MLLARLLTDLGWLKSARKGEYIANIKGHMTDALVLGGDEGRDTLR
jgi:hypothetical protein